MIFKETPLNKELHLSLGPATMDAEALCLSIDSASHNDSES